MALVQLALGGASPRPHILLVVADDLGFGDWGHGDTTVISPELDDLAANGVVLTAMYTWMWCAPSRGQLLSGRYAAVSGFQGASGPTTSGRGLMTAFPLQHQLLPAVLKPAGYATVMAGKYHLGYARAADVPERRGFDRWLGYFTGGEDYYAHTSGGAPGCHDAVDLWYGSDGQGRPAARTDLYFSGRYSTEIYSSFVVTQIDHHNVTVPLFVYAAFQGVRLPQPPPLLRHPPCC